MNDKLHRTFSMELECHNKVGATAAGEQVDIACLGCPALHVTVRDEDGNIMDESHEQIDLDSRLN